jgi:hypothetical protein
LYVVDKEIFFSSRISNEQFCGLIERKKKKEKKEQVNVSRYMCVKVERKNWANKYENECIKKKKKKELR